MGVVRFTIRIPGASSLKDRRQVVRSLLESARSRFNASTADLGPDGVWDAARLVVACAGSSARELDERMEQICGMFERMGESGEFEPIDVEREVFSYDDIQDREAQ